MYTIHEIANLLIALVREQKFVEAYEQLYADGAVSIDPNYADKPPLKGLANLVEREKQFLSRTEIHRVNISEPVIVGNYFTISLSMDFTINGQGKKELEELCVYKVENGKIISQQFFMD
ncbi:MAG TPA: nuclear transport factor 2 family protein [Mucilaginibacter sp.]|nr:nuclear transport factor 2 family protein [Mucilaginibacter sp.]